MTDKIFGKPKEYFFKDGVGKHRTRDPKTGEVTVYGPGDRIMLADKEAEGIKDKIKLVEKAKPNDMKRAIGFVLVPDPNVPGKFNVMNTFTEKILNSKPMTMNEADAFVGDLMAGVAVPEKKEPEPEEPEEPEKKTSPANPRTRRTRKAK